MASNNLDDIKLSTQAYYIYDLSIEDIEVRNAHRLKFDKGRDVLRYTGLLTYQQLDHYTRLHNGRYKQYYCEHLKKHLAIRKASSISN